MKIRHSLSISFILLLSLSAWIKKDGQLDAILSYFEQLRTAYPNEKVYLHFDKPYYSIGDDIWFKAYLVTSEKNELSSMSKVLYIDVVDEQDSIRKRLTLPVTNGLSDGSISLPDSVFSIGNYHIRAYTKWMQNFDQSYFFNKVVPIGDALNSRLKTSSVFSVTAGNNGQQLNAEISYQDLTGLPKDFKPVSYVLLYEGKTVASGSGQTNAEGKISFKTVIKNAYNIRKLVLHTIIKTEKNRSISQDFNVKNTDENIDLKFFPEGGNLVYGLPSKVVYKAIGSDGLSREVEGYLEDGKGNKLIGLKTTHAGMGIFTFTPEAGNDYTAVIQSKNGVEKRLKLPLPDQQGYVLAVNNSDNERVSLKVLASPTLVNGKDLIVVAQSNSKIEYVSKIKMDKQVALLNVEKKFLYGGIVHFTLFSEAYLPIAERLAFVEPQDSLSISLNSDKAIYTTRALVNMQLEIKNAKQEPITGAFSVAVTNRNKVSANEDEEQTILSNLLLTSDLKGHVEGPGYYFNAENPERRKHLDLLMLSQGWSRFKWADVQSNKFPNVKYKPEQAVTVSGQIVSFGNKPVANAKITLFAPSVMLVLDTVADATGHFVFNDLNLEEGVNFVVKAKNEKNKDHVKIILDDDDFLFQKADFLLKSESLNTSMLNYLKSTEARFNELLKFGLINRGITLEEVTIRSKRPPVIPYSVLAKEINVPNLTITPEQMQNRSDVTDILRDKLAGLTIRNNKAFYRNNIANPLRGSTGRLEQSEPGEMLILLDGVILEDLTPVAPLSLSGIQVYKGGAVSDMLSMIYAGSDPAGHYGIIFLTTERKATKYNTRYTEGIARTRNKGYTVVKEFYSPTYEVKQTVGMLDLRSTIYWNPHIITSSNGKADFCFYSADEPGNYQAILEGLDTNGHLVRYRYNFEIKL